MDQNILENQKESLTIASKEFGTATVVADVVVAESTPNQRAVLNLLALANEAGLEAGPLMKSLAAETRGKFKWKAWELGEQIEKGTDPVVALNDPRLAGLLPPSGLLAVKLASDEGQIDQFYKTVYKLNPPGLNVREDDDALTRIGLLWVRWNFALAIVGFLLLKIAPEFMKMHEEFGIELSTQTKWFFMVADQVSRYSFLIFIAFIPFFIWLVNRYWRRLWPSLWQKRVVTKSAKMRTSLSIAIDADPNLNSIVGRLKKFRPLKRLSKKFENAHEKIGQGENGWNALSGQRLISARESKILTMASGNETQSWLLRWFAESSLLRREARDGVLVNLLIVIGNLLLAGLVLASALFVFTSLIQIMGGSF